MGGGGGRERERHRDCVFVCSPESIIVKTLGPWAEDPMEFWSSGLPRGQDRRPTQAPRAAGTAGKVYLSSSS